MSESSNENVSDLQLTGSTLKELKLIFTSRNYSDEEISGLMKYRKRIKSKHYTRESRARYRDCIRKRETEKTALKAEKNTLMREIAFWKSAVYLEYNDDVFLPTVAPMFPFPHVHSRTNSSC